MARVATAYVEIRPDLSGFAAELKVELAKIKAVEKVAIEPETKDFGNKVAAALTKDTKASKAAKELSSQLGELASTHFAAHFDVDPDTLTAPMDEIGQSVNDAFELLGDQAEDAFTREFVKDVKGHMRAEMRKPLDDLNDEIKLRLRHGAEDAAQEWTQSFAGRTTALSRKELAGIERDMSTKYGQMGGRLGRQVGVDFNKALAKSQADAFAAEVKSRAEFDKKIVALQKKWSAARIKASAAEEKEKLRVQADADAKSLAMNRLSFQVRKQMAADAAKAENEVRRIANENAAKVAVVALRKQFTRELSDTKTNFAALADSIGDSMEKQFGAVGRKMGRAMVRDFAHETKKVKAPKVDSSFLNLGKSMSRLVFAGFASIGRIRGLGILRGLSGVTKGIEAGLVSMFKNLGGLAEQGFGILAKGASTALGAIGAGMTKVGLSIGESVSDISVKAGAAFTTMGLSIGSGFATLAGTAGPIAAVAAAVLALTLAYVGLAVVGGIVQTLMAALGAVFFGVTAAIESTIAAVVQLGVVLGAGLALLPGFIATLAPAIIVLGVAISALQKSTKKNGDLFIMANALRAMIVEAVGLGKIIDRLVKVALPALGPPIIAIAKALSRALNALTDFATSTKVLEQLTFLFGQSALFIERTVPLVIAFSKAFLILAVAAQPALTAILGTLTSLEERFAAWMSTMQASGQMAGFFDNIATAVQAASGLIFGLSTFLGNFFSAALPSASKLLFILKGWVDRWSDFMATSVGAGVWTTFFDTLNAVFVTLLPVVEAVVGELIKFAPSLKSVMDVVGPVLAMMAVSLGDLVTAAIPGFIAFMEKAREILADPKVQQAFIDLGVNLGDLIASLATFDPAGAVQFIEDLGAIVNAGAKVVRALQDTYTDIHEFKQKIDRLFGRENKNNDAADAAQQVKSLADTYGAATAQIIGMVRGMGVSNRTTDAQIVASLRGVQNAYGNSVQSAQTFAIDTAAQFGVVARSAIDNAAVVTTVWAGSLAALAAAAKSATPNWRLIGTVQGSLNQAEAAKPKAPDLAKFIRDFKAAMAAATSAANPVVEKAGGMTAAGFLSSLTPALANGVNWEDIVNKGKAYDQGKEIAHYLAKGITSGAANIAKVTTWLQKGGMARQVEAIRKAVAKYNAITAAGHGLKYWQDQLQVIKDFRAKAFEALTPNRDLVGVFGFFPTPAEVTAQLQTQLATMRNFTSGVAALVRRGLSSQLATAWLQAGAETAGNLVEGLKDATPAQLAQINGLYNTIGTEATAQTESMATQMFGAGQATVQGYINGILAQQSSVSKTIQDLLDKAIKAAKAKLGIKSPSKVFGLMGVQTMAGYINAVGAQAGRTVGAVEDVFGKVTNVPPARLPQPVLPRTPLPGVGALGDLSGRSVTPVNVQVFLGTKEITDILRVLVDGQDTTSARALLAGRRGG